MPTLANLRTKKATHPPNIHVSFFFSSVAYCLPPVLFTLFCFAHAGYLEQVVYLYIGRRDISDYSHINREANIANELNFGNPSDWYIYIFKRLQTYAGYVLWHHVSMRVSHHSSIVCAYYQVGTAYRSARLLCHDCCSTFSTL